jgi:PAS domain S-box-containing protein
MQSSRETIHVLHVDDDPEFADMVARLIEREDERFLVKTAVNAEEGLDRLDESHFDCIVSDYDMPGRTGIEFLEAVRVEYPNLPFLLFTGKGSEEVASEAISAGVTDYLQKESGTEQYRVLANRIRNGVERAHAQTERQRQLNAIETAGEGISILDDKRQFIYVNQAYANLYGYDPDDLIGKHWHKLYREEDIESIRKEVLPTVESEGYWEGETVGVCADGTTFTEAHRLSLTENDELVCTVRDISDQIERERELEQATTRLEALFENSPDMINLHDSDGRILDVNQKFCEALGTSAGELVGRKVWEIDAEIEPDEFYATIDEIDLGERRRLETEYRKGDGSMLPVEVHVVRLSIDGRDRFMIISRDITERKEYERRLKTLNETAQRLMAVNSREQVAEIGVGAAQTVVGLEANAIHLHKEESDNLVPVAQTEGGNELVGDPPTFQGGDSIAWRAYESGEILGLDDVREDPAVYNPETDVRSELFLPLGEHGLLIAASESPGAFGERDRVLGEILAGSLTTALDQVDRIQQLRARERDLKEQNKRLEEFSGVVSHDLRNPLNVAIGRLEHLQLEFESPHLDAIETALDRMDRIIQDVLWLAREGRDIGATEQIALVDVVDAAWTIACDDAADADIHCASDDVRQTVVEADTERLRQLLENLFRNAVEHGGDDVTVTVGALDDGFYIADDGPGVRPEQRETVFEASYSTSDDGTGFGLHIVEQIVNAHGWSIAVAASDSGGARFEITGV